MLKKYSILLIIILITSLVSFSTLQGCNLQGTKGRPEDNSTRFKDQELTIQGSDTLLEVSMYWVENFLTIAENTGLLEELNRRWLLNADWLNRLP